MLLLHRGTVEQQQHLHRPHPHPISMGFSYPASPERPSVPVSFFNISGRLSLLLMLEEAATNERERRSETTELRSVRSVCLPPVVSVITLTCDSPVITCSFVSPGTLGIYTSLLHSVPVGSLFTVWSLCVCESGSCWFL